MKRLIEGLFLGVLVAATAWAEASPPASGAPEIAVTTAAVADGEVLRVRLDWAAAQRCAAAESPQPEPVQLEQQRQSLLQHPDDAVAALCLGVAASRAGDKTSADRLLMQALRLAPEQPAVHYALAGHYDRHGIYSEAGDYYDSVLQLDPAGPLAAQAQTGLERATARQQRRSWQLQLNAGLQYDSNVILLGQDQPQPAGYSGQGDWSGVFSLRADYTPYRHGRQTLTAGYRLYQSLHTSLHDYDVTQNLLTLAGSHDLRSNLQLKLEGGYEFLHLAGAVYDQAWQVTPSLMWQPGSGGLVMLDYRFRSVAYRDSALMPNNTLRDGTNHHVGLTYFRPVTADVSLIANYAHDEEFTEVAYWDFGSDRASLVVRWRAPFDLAVDLAGDASRRRYDGVDPLQGATREDTQYTAALTVTRPLTEALSLSLGEVYIRNHSNLAPYDYERSLTSLFLVARY